MKYLLVHKKYGIYAGEFLGFPLFYNTHKDEIWENQFLLFDDILDCIVHIKELGMSFPDFDFKKLNYHKNKISYEKIRYYLQ